MNTDSYSRDLTEVFFFFFFEGTLLSAPSLDAANGPGSFSSRKAYPLVYSSPYHKY